MSQKSAGDLLADKAFTPWLEMAQALDSIGAGLVLADLKGKIIFASKTALWLTDKTEEELIGKPCSQALGFGPDSPCPSPGADQDAKTADINPVWRAVRDEHGKTAGHAALFQDHSAFRDLLSRVRHEDRRLKTILDTLETGVLTVDRGGHISFFNATAETLTGYARSEILGKHFSMLFAHKVNPDVYLLQKTIADAKPRVSREGILKTSKGERIPVRARYMALKNEQGRVIGGLVTFSDLSLMYQLEGVIRDKYTFFDMVGQSPAITRLFEIIPVVAASDATILIEGPTGTGKDLLAKVIHNASPRAKKPLIKVNCAALPDTLLESEMFGYSKGAFTGADKDKPGRFQDADNGTLFLDEIGDMPLALQAKLLRVIEDKEFYPLGGRKVVRVNTRIIAATNRDLMSAVAQKAFRQDLFYRLNVVRLELPALTQRKVDLHLLVAHILRRLCATRETSVEKISEPAMKLILEHDYPGNVRELENILEHALILCPGAIIEKEHLPDFLERAVRQKQGLEADSDSSAAPTALDLERQALTRALEKHRGNQSAAAKELGIHRTTLWRKAKKLGIGVF
jgi:PAS domain S-box-containing protein